jgi:integrase
MCDGYAAFGITVIPVGLGSIWWVLRFGVQQKLMRHAQIATTMNVYGNAMMESKREANSKVVQMALRQEGRKAK